MNSKIYSLVSAIVVAVLLIIGTILCWMAMKTEVDEETKQAIGDGIAVHNSVIYTLILFWASLILVLVFTVWGIIINPKRFIPSMIGVAIMFVIYLVCSGLSKGEATPAILEHPMATSFWLKSADIGIYMTYTLFGLALVLLVVQMFRNIFSYVSK